MFMSRPEASRKRTLLRLPPILQETPSAGAILIQCAVWFADGLFMRWALIFRSPLVHHGASDWVSTALAAPVPPTATRAAPASATAVLPKVSTCSPRIRID